jgi:hypothetical protein
LQKFDFDIARISVDSIAVQRIIRKLSKEKKMLEDRVRNSIRQDNPLIGELYQLISSYAMRLGLDKKQIGERSDYVFTSDLKSLSGAIFHKLVFAFKISYVKLIQEHTDVCLPIILDSPNGREVSKENISEMMSILAEDFADHQIIIASIYSDYPFPDKKIIEVKDRLLPF